MSVSPEGDLLQIGAMSTLLTTYGTVLAIGTEADWTHSTLIADVIPMAPGRCEATFTNGHGEKLRLPVTVE